MIVKRPFISTAAFALLLMASWATPAMAQREAAFMPPSQSGGKREGDEIVAATPKVIEAGETIPGITKHLTLFFTNFGNTPAKISNISLSADSNVRAEISDNDCEKVGAIKPNDKCSIGLQVTPNSPGEWTAEIVMVHDAAGRVSRATVNGKTAGEIGATGQQPGLSLVGANKDQQIDFGEVEINAGLAVRSVLLANDSPQPLTVKTIDLVGADRDLSLMPKGGCVEDQEVPPGGSCPVTVIWQPSGRGNVSTDLIIQHTGPVGFAVIPVRGKIAGGEGGGSSGGSSNRMGGTIASALSGGSAVSVAPPASDNVAEAAAATLPLPKSKKGNRSGVPPVSASALYGKGGFDAGDADIDVPYTLRGTVGSRAILATEDGRMVVAGMGESLTSADGVVFRILNVEPTRVTIEASGRQMQIFLQSPSSSFGSNSIDKSKTTTKGATGLGSTSAKGSGG